MSSQEHRIRFDLLVAQECRTSQICSRPADRYGKIEIVLKGKSAFG